VERFFYAAADLCILVLASAGDLAAGFVDVVVVL